MRYVSIDLETSGLDPLCHDILEMAAIIDDLSKPWNPNMPTFHRYIYHDTIVGQPEALAMHGRILKHLAAYDPFEPSDGICLLDELGDQFYDFLLRNGYDGDSKIIAAGKNFASFDKLFLEQVPGMPVFHHRSIDPTTYYLRPDDTVPPGLTECLQRAGLPPAVYHEASRDAVQVIQLIRQRCPCIQTPNSE